VNPWQYDEHIHVGTDYAAVQEAESYDQRMGTVRNVAAEADCIAEALVLTRDSAVWEIGTGTGECALALAPRCRQVWASDISPAMLAVAKRKAAERSIANIAFGDGGFLAGFAPDGPVHGIVSQLALHHLPDFWKFRALQRLSAFLCPGGRLYLRDVVFPGGLDDYDQHFAEFVGSLADKGGAKMAEATSRHIRDEYSTFDWVLEGMLERCGLRIIDRGGDGFLTYFLLEK
jgi:ubiquinone/menaquinone biosynthesis C-methylase UbiE